MDAEFLESGISKKHGQKSISRSGQYLLPISRQTKREEMGMPTSLPLFGYDTWNHYEVSWLNNKGKPQISMAEIVCGCNSPNMIESKSMRLYFNSLNNIKFEDSNAVKSMILRDIAACVGTNVFVELLSLSFYRAQTIAPVVGECIDNLDIETSCYTVNPSLLSTEQEQVEEVLYSDLFRSNCLVSNQPDWGNIKIVYKGKKINREGLLKYIVSFRNHDEFLEQCIERIFIDIQQKCSPEQLTVSGRYTRRGGLDINPIRSSHPLQFENLRDIRQ